MNVAFQQAAHKVLLDDDNLLPLLHLTVDYQGKDSKGLLFLVLQTLCSWKEEEDKLNPDVWRDSTLMFILFYYRTFFLHDYHYCFLFKMRQAQEMEPPLLKTRLLGRFLPPAGRLSASLIRSSGRCTSSSLLPSWRSV